MRLARSWIVLAVAGATLAVPAVASAQTDALVAVGAGASAVDRDGHATMKWSIPMFRLPRPEGISFDWDIGRASTSELHRWQYLFGPAYDVRAGRAEAIASVVVGPSVNRSLVSGLDVRNSWAVEPRVALWIDLNDWLGLNLSAAYVSTRADAFTSPGGAPAGRLEDEHVRFQTGIVVKAYPW
jgi:hypothetical protein